MPTVAHWSEESATAPIENAPSRELIRLARIARLAQVASERLMVGPDDASIVDAMGDLAVIVALCGEVLR